MTYKPHTERSANTQQAILYAIRLHHKQHGYAPTIRELQAACDISSTSVVTYHLERLQEVGLLTWQPGMARTIRLVKSA